MDLMCDIKLIKSKGALKLNAILLVFVKTRIIESTMPVVPNFTAIQNSAKCKCQYQSLQI